MSAGDGFPDSLGLAYPNPEPRETGSGRTLTSAERVAYQRAIEEIYRRHRIWPKENAGPKPALDAMISPGQIERKVDAYLRTSRSLADERGRPIAPSELQAEMDRMATYTKQPEVLRELFAALGNDPFVIAECLARPILAERLAAGPMVAADVSPAPATVCRRHGCLYREPHRCHGKPGQRSGQIPGNPYCDGLHRRYLDSHQHCEPARWS